MSMEQKKYPRTPHLTWSPGATNDDVFVRSADQFTGKQVVVTEKMDGECTGLTRHRCHARSLDSRDHVSRHWVKSLHASIKCSIPQGWKVFGENLFARHSIAYEELSSYFLAFSIWNEENVCLSWEDTVQYCDLLELQTVPVLYEGTYDESLIKASWKPQEGEQKSEGYVVRLADSFPYEDFGKCVAKYVRKNHVQTDSHWMHSEIVPNGLKQ